MSKRQVLRINTRKQFEQLIDHLTTEVHRARDHWNLWRDLNAVAQEYWQEMAQSQQFWRLTLQAHQDSAILRLTRLFDPSKGALSLGNFLRAIRGQISPNVPGSLGLDLSGVDTAALDQEMSSVSKSDSTVSNLLTIRKWYLAHRAADLVSGDRKLPQFTAKEIEALLGQASQIVDKYRQICGKSFISPSLPEADDYRNLFRLLRSAVSSRESFHTNPAR